MRDEFFKLIRPIALRLRINRSLRAAILASIAGCLLSFAIAPYFLFVILTTILLPLCIATLVFFLDRNKLQEAVIAIDDFFSLKDRVRSAFETVSQDSEISPIAKLQIQDAISYLKSSKLKQVIPISHQHAITFASCLMVGLAFSVFLPTSYSASFQKITSSNSNTSDPTIESILDSQLDNSQKLRSLSKLEFEIAKRINSSVFEASHEEWSEIAEALEAIPSTSEIAKDIREKRFQSASQRFEKLDSTSLSDIERKTLEENFRRISRTSDSEIKKTLKQISASLENDSKKEFQSGIKSLSTLANQQNELLELQKKLKNSTSQIKLAKRAVSNSSFSGAPEKSNQKEDFLRSQRILELDKNGTFKDSKSSSDSNPQSSNSIGKTTSPQLMEYEREMEKIIKKEEIPPAYRKTVRNYFTELQRLSAEKKNEKRKRENRE